MHQLRDGVVVADDHAVEAELVAQPATEQRDMCGHGNPCQIGKRRHDGGHARGNRRRECGQMHFMHRAFGYVDRRILTAAVDRPIRTVMFGNRGQCVGCGQVVALKAMYFGLGNTRTQHGSSPGPSALRPHRGSRDTSSMGANVMARPSAAASRADSLAVSAHVAGSNTEASPNGIGNSVR